MPQHAQPAGRRGRGRPPKFDDDRAATIVERLRQGWTRKDAAESVDVTYRALWSWLERGGREKEGAFAKFLHSVTHAEAEAAGLCTSIIRKAAVGYETGHTTRTTKTVFKPRETRYPDGRVVKEEVPHQEVTESVTTGREFDPKYALEWLKRRRPEDWGDRIDVRQIPDDGLVRLLNRASGQRSAASGPGEGDPAGAGRSSGNGNGKHG